MPQQAKHLGTLGALGESVVEAAHVKDNGFKRQYSHANDLQLQLAQRAKVYWRHAGCEHTNIMAQEDVKALRARTAYKRLVAGLSTRRRCCEWCAFCVWVRLERQRRCCILCT
jgi:hypothetical protein